MFRVFVIRDSAVETDNGQFNCPNCNEKNE